MKVLLFTFVFCSLQFSMQSKTPAAGMNLGLHLKMMQSPDSPELINVLVKGDVSCVTEQVLRTGGVIITSAGDISSLRVPLKELESLLRSNCVQRIEAYPENMKLLNDTMRLLSRVDDVHIGLPPLSTSYKGSNVLIGYIDSGIDLHHPDFQDSLGNTRVAWLWDMTKPVAANTPLPYGYGQEWSASDINAGLAVSHTGEDEFGHGTYVAGIGSGNGRSVGHFQGVAPESDIMVVSYDFNATDTVSRIVHAIDYLFAKANLLGKPCVINASLGDYYGSHDGKDLQSQFIRNMIQLQSGRVVVAAAGNVGLYPFHLGRTSTSGDTTFTWFKYNSSYGGAYVQIFADTADFNQISYAIAADKVSPYFDFRGMTPFSGIAPTINTVVSRNIFNGPNRIGVVQTLATINEGVYELEIYVLPDSAGYNWRFVNTGNGHFDSWSFDWEFQNLPSAAVFPPISKYYLPDTMQTIVTGMACLDQVITVGNYFNTDRHVDINGTLQISPGDQPGDLASNSSRGPTRDGRIKPDVSAPGHHIISCGVLTQIPGMISAQPHKVAQGGYHITGGGTSASAPVVAGIAALYLEQNPASDWQDVKSAILSCAYRDALTWGPDPNNAWGYGKADAFGTLTACGTVNVSDERPGSIEVVIFPNPAYDKITIQFAFAENILPVRFEILEPSGRILRAGIIDSYQTSIDVSTLTNGIFWLKFTNKKERTDFKPMMVQHPY
jgi:subtilisin family serine protease